MPSWSCCPPGGGDHQGGGLGGLHRVVEEQPVEPVQHLPDAEALAGEEPQPGAGEAGDDGGLGTGALDVAEDEAPAVAGAREDVVEVAADHAVVARLVHEGAGDAGDVGDLAGEQSALEDAADGGLPGVGAGGPHGEAEPADEVLDERGDGLGHRGVSLPPDDDGAERAAPGGDPERERGPVGAAGARGAAGPFGPGGRPRYGDRYGSGPRRGREREGSRLQGGAQGLGAALVAVPDLDGAGLGGRLPALGLQPDRAPVGQPGHQELARYGRHQILVELPGEQVGRLREEGGGAPAVPDGVVALGAPGDGGEEFGGAQAAPEGVRFRLGGRGAPVVDGEAGPDRLAAGAVGDAPGVGEGGDELEAAPVLGGVGQLPGGGPGGFGLRGGVVAADGAGRVVVGDLQDEGRGRLLAALLQRDDQVDGGPGVHDGVGDQLVGDGHGVVGEPVAEPHGGGHPEPGPLRERGPHEPPGRGRGERNSGQARTTGRATARHAPGTGGAGTLHGVPLQGKGRHGTAPTVRRHRQSDRRAAHISTELLKWAENRAHSNARLRKTDGPWAGTPATARPAPRSPTAWEGRAGALRRVRAGRCARGRRRYPYIVRPIRR